MPTAEEHFEEGKKHLQEKRWDDAIASFTKAIELKPDYAEAYSNRGIAYFEKGEHDRAIEDYNKAIERNPDYAEAYTNRGNAYYRKGEYDRAIEDHNRTIERKPNLAEAYNNRGSVYGSKGEYARAVEDFNKAIELKPNYAKAYNNRGNAYSAKGEHDQAIDDYTRAIELKSDYGDAYSNRGDAYSAKGEHDRAIQDFNKAIELNPKLAEAYNNRGNAYSRKSEHDRAIEDYTKAIELKPNFAKAIHNRAGAMALKASEKERKRLEQELRQKHKEELDKLAKQLKKDQQRGIKESNENLEYWQQYYARSRKRAARAAMAGFVALGVLLIAVGWFLYTITPPLSEITIKQPVAPTDSVSSTPARIFVSSIEQSETLKNWFHIPVEQEDSSPPDSPSFYFPWTFYPLALIVSGILFALSWFIRVVLKLEARGAVLEQVFFARKELNQRLDLMRDREDYAEKMLEAHRDTKSPADYIVSLETGGRDDGSPSLSIAAIVAAVVASIRREQKNP